MAYKGTRAKAGIKMGDSAEVIARKWADYSVEKAVEGKKDLGTMFKEADAIGKKYEPGGKFGDAAKVVAESNRLNPPKKNSRAGMTAEQKIAQRRQEQAANPERFQSVIKNKSKVLKKTTNMGGDYKAVNKVVTADRNRRRQTGDGEFRRAQQAAGTRSANKLTKQAAAPRQSKAEKGDGMAAVAKKLGTVKPKKSAEVIAKEKKAKASKSATNRFKKVLG